MRDITLCHPRLQKIASAWIKACATEEITVAISETGSTFVQTSRSETSCECN